MDDHLYATHSITWRLWLATAVSWLSTFQFGFHLSVFNAPQDIISCQNHVVDGLAAVYEDTFWGSLDRLQCIPMEKNGIAMINTIFTGAGFLSSTMVGSHTLSSVIGRNTMQKITAFLFFMGSLLIAFANSQVMINFGRFFAGFAAGSCMVIAPIFINEITPFNHRGLIGSLLQFGVPCGILLAQLIAFPWSNDYQWRNLFMFGAGIGLLQLILLFATIESPKWLIMNSGEITKACNILFRLRTDNAATQYEILHWRRMSTYQSSPESTADVSETSSLIGTSIKDGFVPLSTAMSRRGSIDPSSLSPLDYLTGGKYKKEWIAILIIMSAQQLSGMNAITFYGVSVLSNIMPPGTNVLILTSSLAATNMVVSLVTAPLIDKLGRRFLILLSMGAMGVCATIISSGLLAKNDYVAAFGCFGFNIGFSIGLGQIPFLMISELSSHEAIGKAQSLGTMCNWLSNVAIAYSFPLARNIFGDSVFFMFGVTGLIFFVAIFMLVPETKGRKSYDEVWGTG